ncbi:hypothetical protein ACFSTC_25040 [Nonomuraea ferruginea]
MWWRSARRRTGCWRPSDVEGAAELNARTWLGPEADEATRRRVVEMQRHAFAGQLAADPEPSQFSPEYDLDAITVPALIVTGPYDLPYFRAGARHLAQLAGGRRAGRTGVG